ncbi:surface lipoprotein assembly modifier, partial [Neisseria sp. P0009.S008]|uniref:surface lipoprotein assembly modifier n=1 Tax=Neisseria sp. P0009.S008 TaxID=3436715 RepID=UPI003F7D7D92
YNTLSYFPRNDLMLYGGIYWHQCKDKEPVDSYLLISARLGAAKMFEAGFDASASATYGIRSHREENDVLEQPRRDKEK